MPMGGGATASHNSGSQYYPSVSVSLVSANTWGANTLSDTKVQAQNSSTQLNRSHSSFSASSAIRKRMSKIYFEILRYNAYINAHYSNYSPTMFLFTFPDAFKSKKSSDYTHHNSKSSAKRSVPRKTVSPCDACGNTFARKDSLMRHRKLHCLKIPTSRAFRRN
jgi:phenylalanyl-tRNA synthetase alpha subunit